MTYSRSQNSWSYLLLIIVCLKGGYFCSSIIEVLPSSGCFITCMGAHFPQLSWITRSGLAPRMSVFLWHSSKWAHGFGRFLQYMSGLEVLACSFDTDLNNAPTAPFFEPLSLWVYSQRQILCNASSALSWTRRPLLYIPAKYLNV